MLERRIVIAIVLDAGTGHNALLCPWEKHLPPVISRGAKQSIRRGGPV